MKDNRINFLISIMTNYWFNFLIAIMISLTLVCVFYFNNRPYQVPASCPISERHMCPACQECQPVDEAPYCLECPIISKKLECYRCAIGIYTKEWCDINFGISSSNENEVLKKCEGQDE